jgi:hypothetical protein
MPMGLIESRVFLGIQQVNSACTFLDMINKNMPPDINNPLPFLFNFAENRNYRNRNYSARL